MMATDIIVGIVRAFLGKSDKSKNGGISAQSMFRGGIRKILIFLMIALGTLLDEIIAPSEAYIRSAVVCYYAANEMVSILENIGACGIPLPKIFNKVLDIIRKDYDK